MKDWEYNVALILSVGCLVMAIWIMGAGRANEKLQARLQAQQAEIDRGNLSRQIGNRIIQDMVACSSTNAAMRNVLEKYGFVPTAPAAAKTPARQTSVPARSKSVKQSAGR